MSLPWFRSHTRLDADTVTWRNAVLTDGGLLSTSSVFFVDRLLVRPLKAADLWTKMLMIDPCVGGNLQSSFHRLKIPTGVTRKCSTGGMVDADYNETGANGGRVSDGSSKYIDTLINPSALSFSVSSFMMWAYTRTVGTAGTSRVTMGNSVTTLLGWIASGTKESVGIAAASAAEIPAGSASSLTGLLGGGTNGSRDQQFYANGSAVGAASAASNVFSNANIYAHATSNSGTPASYSNRRISSMFMTTGLSAAEAVTFNFIVQSFEAALGRQV